MEKTEFIITDAGVLTKYQGKSEDVVVPEGVKVIARSAFELDEETRMRWEYLGEDGSTIKSILLPSSLECIEEKSFATHSNLEKVDFVDYDNSHLVRIGREAFASCESLREIRLPNSLLKIDSAVFAFCSSLQEIIIPDSVLELGDSYPVFPIGVFTGCKELRNVHLSKGLLVIEAETFMNCKSLGSVELPKSLKRIEAGAFGYCYNLSEISLPSSLEEIGERAFGGCLNLSVLNLPDSLQHIDFEAFYLCNLDIQINGALLETLGKNYFVMVGEEYEIDENHVLVNYKGRNETLIIPKGVVAIADGAMVDVLPSEVLIPETVTKIGSGAFAGNYFLREIIIPDSVTEIGAGAFERCVHLSKVKLSNNLIRLEDGVFADNVLGRIRELVIPRSIKSIGEDVFSNLESVWIHTSQEVELRVLFERYGAVVKVYEDEKEIEDL